MHPSRSDTEKYIGAHWIARSLGIHSYKVWYSARKLRLRFFKFSGVRYIELEDSLCLIERLRFQYGLDKDLTDEVISEIRNLQS